MLLDIGGLAVFGVAALAAFLAVWHEHDFQRSVILHTLIAIVIVRVTALFARFLLARGMASERLLPFADAPARALRRFAVIVAALYGVLLVAQSVLRNGGASTATIDVLIIVMVLTFVAFILRTVWRIRVPIADLIRGSGKPGAIVGWLADLWPVIATAYVLIIAGARIYDIFSGTGALRGRAPQHSARHRAADRRHGAVPRPRGGGSAGTGACADAGGGRRDRCDCVHRQ